MKCLIGALACLGSQVSADNHFTADTLIAQASCKQLLSTGRPNWVTGAVELANDHLTGTLSRVTSESYTNVGEQTGMRFTGTLTNNKETVGQITWSTIEEDSRIKTIQIITSDGERAHLMWQLDENCQPVQHRQLVYPRAEPTNTAQNASPAIGLRVLNVEDGAEMIVEPLNPPVPTPSSVPDKQKRLVRVALVDSGVNYTLPEINDRLARDDNGELIGFDFWDNDNLPFDAHFGQSQFHVIRHGTGTASLLLSESPAAELVAYRNARNDLTQLDAIVEHAAANNVRVIGIPFTGNDIEQWEAFEKTALANPSILFIASAGNNGINIDEQTIYPAALDIPNMLVVTSANDLVQPAERANWGPQQVDYMLPAEEQSVLNFFNQKASVSGAAYAVPRAMGIAIRWLAEKPYWQAPQLIIEFKRQYGQEPTQYVSGGYIADPLSETSSSVELVGIQTLPREGQPTEGTEQTLHKLPLSVFVLHDDWTVESVNQNLFSANEILQQCNIAFNSVTVTQLSVPEYLQDLSVGSAKTLTDELENDREHKPIKVFFARENQLSDASSSVSFSRSNSAEREWLEDSVWILENSEEPAIALVQELFHVLADSDTHSYFPNNVMLAEQSAENTTLLPEQCDTAIKMAKAHFLLFD